MDKNWCHNTAINSSSATECKREKGEESLRIIAIENARKTFHTLTDECVEPNALKGITPRMKPWQHIFCPSGRGMMRETERDCPGWKTETDQLKWICTSAEWTSTLKTVCMLSGHTINTHTYTLLLLRHLKQTGKDRLCSETESGHIWYSALQLWSFQETRSSQTARGDKNVAGALTRSKLNPRLIVKLSMSHCTFGKWHEEKWTS